MRAKRESVILIAIMTSVVIMAGDIKFTISDGVNNDSVKYKMESSVSRILNEVNAAQKVGRSLNFTAMNINDCAQQSMSKLWENSPFVCTDEDIVEHCITTGTGYQVRNIPMMMKPRDERGSNDDEYQEAVFNFDKNGNIDNFYLSIPMNLYVNVINSNLELTDLRRRQLILDFVEQYQTAYIQKDIEFISQVFSEDQLVFTGKMKTTKLKDGILPTRLQDIKQNKEKYIRNLRRVFQRNSNIKVSFSDIEVMRHLVNPDFYGVTLLQSWTCDKYHDSGYFFMLWDFTIEEAPEILIRTWQPDMIGGKPLPKDEVFSLSDFDI